MADKPLEKTSVPSSKAEPPTATVEEDSDPDFDDLDDVLDQFSANAPPKAKPPPAPISDSAPGKSSVAESVLPAGPKPDETEEQFIERLTKEMSAMMTSMGGDQPTSTQTPEDLAKMGKELEAFTRKMEEEGIQPEDLLKAIMGEEEGSKLAEAAHEDAKKDTSQDNKAGSTTFEDTIRRTMNRLDASNTEATNATAQSTAKSEEDMLAEMLKAMESGEGGSEEGLSKMFMDMMQQLTHKDMLYEPMKELNTQYPSWLKSHESRLPKTDFERYSRQSIIVADMVKKFETPGYSDDDPHCREYIWEKMQKMQDEGAPPEELVKNPFPGTEFGGIPGLAGGGGGEGPEEGCPTQ